MEPQNHPLPAAPPKTAGLNNILNNDDHPSKPGVPLSQLRDSGFYSTGEVSSKRKSWIAFWCFQWITAVPVIRIVKHSQLTDPITRYICCVLQRQRAQPSSIWLPISTRRQDSIPGFRRHGAAGTGFANGEQHERGVDGVAYVAKRTRPPF